MAGTRLSGAVRRRPVNPGAAERRRRAASEVRSVGAPGAANECGLPSSGEVARITAPDDLRRGEHGRAPARPSWSKVTRVPAGAAAQLRHMATVQRWRKGL